MDMNVDYMIDCLGEKEAAELYGYITRVHDLKLRPHSSDYIYNLKKLLSLYEFEFDGEEEYLTADLLLEKGLVLHDVELTKDLLIAFVRLGVIVIQRKVG